MVNEITKINATMDATVEKPQIIFLRERANAVLFSWGWGGT